MNKAIVPLVLLLAFASPLCGSVTDELLDQLKSELRTEIKAAREKGVEDRSLYALQELYARVGRLPLREDGNDYNLNEILQGFEVFTGSEKIQQLTTALAAQFRKDVAVKEKSFVDAAEKLAQDSAKQALAAKTAKDLDTAIQALGKFARDTENRSSNNPAMRNAVRQVTEANQFVRQWQDYLAAVDAGNEAGARSQLRSIASSHRDFSLIPRSELLARSSVPETASPAIAPKPAAPTPVAAIVAKVKTLDDLDRAITELGQVERMLSGTESQLASDLRSLARAYADLKAGLATTVTTGVSSSAREELGDVRRLLILFAMPRSLGLPETEKAKPDDNVLGFLQRTLASARLNGDWPLVERVLTRARALNLTDAIASTSDSTMIASWLAGLNQETAKQWVLAVGSFQAALKTGSQVVPAELIGQHLEDIKKAHPQEFEQGVQLMLNPPASDPYGRPSLEYLRSRFPTARDQFPPTPPAQKPEAVLPVPAATPVAK